MEYGSWMGRACLWVGGGVWKKHLYKQFAEVAGLGVDSEGGSSNNGMSTGPTGVFIHHDYLDMTELDWKTGSRLRVTDPRNGVRAMHLGIFTPDGDDFLWDA